MAQRLTPEHPLHKKLEQLEKVAGELGIELIIAGHHILVRDKETGLETKLLDQDGGQPVTEFPSAFEWKLRVED